MGWSIKIECHECNYQQRLFIGFGLNYNREYIFFTDKQNLSRFGELVKDKDEQKLVSRLMQLPNVQVEGSELRIYRCTKCNNLYQNYYYRIVWDDSQHMPNYNCSSCGSSLEMLKVIEGEKIKLINENGNEVKINCPKCGSSKTNFTDGCFDWD